MIEKYKNFINLDKSKLKKINLNRRKAGIEIILAAFLFLFVLFDYISLFKLVSALLAFIVLLEVVRMISDFILDGKKIIRIRLLIDGFIIFFIRDIVLVFSEEKYSIGEKEEKILLIVSLVFVFFIFRILSIAFPPKKN